MSYTLQQIRNQVRYTQFQIAGKAQNLWDAEDEGNHIMPPLLLTALINEAALQVQADLQADLQIQHNSLTENNEVIALPTNMLALNRIVIFDDTNDDDDDEALSAHGAQDGKLLELVSSYNALQTPIGAGVMDGINISADEEAEVVASTGKPSRYMIWEQDSVLYAMFNCRPDANYFIDVYYWAVPSELSADSDTPGTASQYHTLIKMLAIAKVASVLGDQRKLVSAQAEYGNFLATLRAMNAKRHQPSRVQFRMFI